MNNMFAMIPGLQPEELMTLQSLSKDLSEDQVRQFITFYQGKRKESQNIMLLACAGFLGFAGIHRFVLGDTVMGIVYLLTVGFCGIGTIIDLVNAKKMTSDYNQKQAMETINMVKMLAG